MPSRRKPNIIVVHWHDLGRYVGAYGLRHVRTPHLDAFAEEAVVFDNAFTTAPLCSPSRGSLFTGRYPHSNGLMGLAHLGWEYHANEHTLPMLLAPHGYRSVLVGLQHESADPATLGYDEVVDVNADRQAAPVVAELAVDTLSTLAQERQPFLMVAGMFETHRPFPAYRYPYPEGEVDVPPYLDDSPGVVEDLRGFNAAVTYADEATGRILARVTELGLDDDTVVVFTTDHGIPFPRAKSTLYDAGIEVALLVRPPKRTPRAQPRSKELVSHVDMVPTLLELAGVPVPANVQGVSFAGQLTGTGGGGPRSDVYAEKNWHGLRQYDPIRCVRTAQYKYVVSYEDRPELPLPLDIARSTSADGVDDTKPRARVELYDLHADPHERRNLAGDPALAEVEKDLAERLESWRHETQDPLLKGPIHAARLKRRAGGPRRGRTELIAPQFVQRS